MTTELIGDLIDKLSIVNIKIWDATQKAHIASEQDDQQKAHDLFEKVEAMNIQRKEYIAAINAWFTDKKNKILLKNFTP
ncbi:hypothetical protein A2714_03180 [Candidatus Woesebacteria bacterium RIFCSPHIGHO2_01_FULL_38_9]|uniref:Uncharacterized protein n=2 Tax=Candidatus Woeseibacteriota TaxID=1752722 RepID=A0A1F7Y3R0_9BACT|nr:MAG: hypothetical protein A2714_03180 [Candidatus Woesebacteria bacterium RIFCSPHIGHO2_01_FULL_38_9]OGM61040.1 MAG: hypothetical protein A3A75_02655 [Candidatus Woesebacteria bacterium RIFCSPLOWO2_01_FULL_39_10]HJZ23383.1 DUF4254 domain-containing protein [Candidatus Babeliales bacterium]